MSASFFPPSYTAQLTSITTSCAMLLRRHAG
jgi:hypothetical protein